MIAAVGSAAKRRVLLERGIETVIDYGAGSLREGVLAATNGRGVDIAVETVGCSVFDQAQSALAPMGRIVIAGAASGTLPQPDVAILLARSAGCSTLNLSVVFTQRPRQVRAAWADLTALYAAGRLRPRVGHRFALEQAAEAHRLLESRDSKDKILLDPRFDPDRHGTSLA